MDSEIYVFIVSFHRIHKFRATLSGPDPATSAGPFQKMTMLIPRHERVYPLPGMCRVPEAANAERVKSGGIVDQPFLWL